jgi:hypothetical protein
MHSWRLNRFYHLYFIHIKSFTKLNNIVDRNMNLSYFTFNVSVKKSFNNTAIDTMILKELLVYNLLNCVE